MKFRVTDPLDSVPNQRYSAATVSSFKIYKCNIQAQLNSLIGVLEFSSNLTKRFTNKSKEFKRFAYIRVNHKTGVQD